MAGTGMVPTDKAAFALIRETGDLADGAAKLAGEIGGTSVEAVLAQANRTGARRGAAAAMGSMRPRPADWYAFDDKDQDTADWYPQGLTGSEDSGNIGIPAFIVSWYFKPEAGERGIRVSFLSPKSLKYQHALLVQAKPDGSYGPIDIHAGGIACYGDLLYVADTTRGLRVFDLGNVLDLRTAQNDLGDGKRVGRHGGRLHAFGYRYVIPQTDFWKVARPGPRFSFVSIDRSGDTPRLITGSTRTRPRRLGGALEPRPGGRGAARRVRHGASQDPGRDDVPLEVVSEPVGRLHGQRQAAGVRGPGAGDQAVPDRARGPDRAGRQALEHQRVQGQADGLRRQPLRCSCRTSRYRRSKAS